MESKANEISKIIETALKESGEFTEVMGGIYDPFTFSPTVAVMDNSDPSGQLRLRYRVNILDVTKDVNTWKTENPTTEKSAICRMDNAYIKMCHWTGTQWLDMWESDLKGEVKEWMEIPY